MRKTEERRRIEQVSSRIGEQVKDRLTLISEVRTSPSPDDVHQTLPPDEKVPDPFNLFV